MAKRKEQSPQIIKKGMKRKKGGNPNTAIEENMTRQIAEFLKKQKNERKENGY